MRSWLTNLDESLRRHVEIPFSRCFEQVFRYLASLGYFADDSSPDIKPAQQVYGLLHGQFALLDCPSEKVDGARDPEGAELRGGGRSHNAFVGAHQVAPRHCKRHQLGVASIAECGAGIKMCEF